VAKFSNGRLSAQYTAGIIDGEAWIGAPGGCLRIEVELTFSPLLVRLQKQYGGAFYSRGYRILSKKPVFRWTVSGKTAVHLAHLIKPYSIIKRHQVNLCIKWGEMSAKKASKAEKLAAITQPLKEANAK